MKFFFLTQLANAGAICPALQHTEYVFLVGTVDALKNDLQTYNAPPEAVEAKVQVKECLDQNVSYASRILLSGALVSSLLFMQPTYRE